MRKDLDYYLHQIQKLRVSVSRGGGKAPYQPLLLLSLIEMVEQGLTLKNEFPLSQELIVDDLEHTVRDAAFRKNLVSLYDHRCAFCHLRIVSFNSQNIVDGAHIKPFSKFRDNRYTNGLALCKNHHWAFDRGWFGIDEQYRITIPHDRLMEESAIGCRSIRDFNGETIVLPEQQDFYPSQEALTWHRQAWKIAS